MKFDFVIGNPPYQEMSKNKMTRSIYPDFVRSSQAIGQIVSLVMPARWMSGENGPYRETQHFIDEMLKGDHLQSFHLYPNSSDLFPNVDIKGGVCFFVWNRAYSCDRVNYTITENGAYKKVLTSFRIAENVIIRFPELISILERRKLYRQSTLIHGFHRGIHLDSYPISLRRTRKAFLALVKKSNKMMTIWFTVFSKTRES